MKPITARTDRIEYERSIAPRGLLRILWQKQLHILARVTTAPAATTAPSPTVTPGRISAPAPM